MADLNRLAISDTLFKNVFRDKSILCDYVNAICNLDLKEDNLEIMPIEIKENGYKRGVRLDIRFQEVNGNKVTQANLEAQTSMPEHTIFDNRKIYYAAALYKDAFDSGDSFSKEVYSRTIFFILEDKKLQGSPIKKTIMYEEHDGVKHNQIEIYEIYIKNLMCANVESLSEYDKILIEITSVLVDNDYSIYQLSANKIVKKVVDKIMIMTAEEQKRISEEMSRQFAEEMQSINQEYINIGKAEGIEIGKAEGIEIGKAEGNSEQLHKNVLSMHKNGLSNEDISKYLELSLEEVEEILNNN